MLQQSLPDSQQREVEGSIARFFGNLASGGEGRGWVSYWLSIVRSRTLKAFTCFCEKI